MLQFLVFDIWKHKNEQNLCKFILGFFLYKVSRKVLPFECGLSYGWNHAVLNRSHKDSLSRGLIFFFLTNQPKQQISFYLMCIKYFKTSYETSKWRKGFSKLTSKYFKININKVHKYKFVWKLFLKPKLSIGQKSILGSKIN